MTHLHHPHVNTAPPARLTNERALLYRALATYYRTAGLKNGIADPNLSSVINHDSKHYVVIINDLRDVLAVYRVREKTG